MKNEYLAHLLLAATEANNAGAYSKEESRYLAGTVYKALWHLDDRLNFVGKPETVLSPLQSLDPNDTPF